jgi:hypothetical protein
MRLKHLLAGLLAAGLPMLGNSALAQSQFPTVDANGNRSGAGPIGVVQMCVTTAGADIGAGVGVTCGTHGTTAGGATASTVSVSQLPAPGNGTDATSAPPSALTLIETLTVTNPGAYRVQNQSTATVQMQLCPAGTSPTATSNCTIYLLAPGAGPNAQGADSSPEIPWFTGVIFVRGATGAQVAGRSN